MVDDPNRPDDNHSFFEEDDFLAAERDDQDFDTGDTQKPSTSFKEVWKQNPSLKVFAIFAGIAILFIGFMVFGSDDDLPPGEDTSLVSQGNDVSQPPGVAELPPAYEEAVRQASSDRAEMAEYTEGSAIPTPIARPAERIEAPIQLEENDPLSEWRREAETRRIERQGDTVKDRNLALVPNSASIPVAPQMPDGQQGTQPTDYYNTQQSGLNTGGAQQPPPQNPPLPTGPTPEMVEAYAQQIQTQLQSVMEAQVPKEGVVVSMNIQPGYNMEKYFPNPEKQNNQQAGGQQGNNAAVNSTAIKPIIPAGTIVYAEILTEANSDVPGPVLADIASGPLMGGRAIGTFSAAQRHIVIQFNRVVKDGIEYQTQAFALDPATTLPGMASDINNHYMQRILLPAAAAFVQGFAEAATRQDTDVVIVGDSVVTNQTQELDAKEQVLQGVNVGAQRTSQVLEQESQRPRTIRVFAGTRVGLLFTRAVMDPNQMQPGQQPGGYGQGYGGYGQQAYGQYGQPNQFMGQAGQGMNNMYNAYNAYQQQMPGQAVQPQYTPTPQFAPANFR